jgi:hypothetical protein
MEGAKGMLMFSPYMFDAYVFFWHKQRSLS